MDRVKGDAMQPSGHGLVLVPLMLLTSQVAACGPASLPVQPEAPLPVAEIDAEPPAEPSSQPVVELDPCTRVEQAVDAGDPGVLADVLDDLPQEPGCDADQLLARAASTGVAGWVDLLVEHGFEPAGDTVMGVPLVVFAAASGSVLLAIEALDSGADMLQTGQDGQTALHKAIAGGHGDVFMAFVEHGAKLSKTEKQDALLAFARSGHVAAAAYCLDKGAKLEAVYGDQQTVLYYAIDAHQVEMVEFLLGKGAKTEIRDRDGWRPIHLASYRGYADVVEALVEGGADVDGKDADGKTALTHAAAHGHDDLVALLIELGADLDSQDREDKTALMHAAAAGRSGAVKLLLDAGADATLVSDTGKDALFYAGKAGPGAPAVVELIEQALSE